MPRCADEYNGWVKTFGKYILVLTIIIYKKDWEEAEKTFGKRYQRTITAKYLWTLQRNAQAAGIVGEHQGEWVC